MKALRDLTEGDLNQRTLHLRREWSLGMLEAANLINEMYSNSTIHLYAIGDCLLGKLNLLRKGSKVRRNPGMATAIEAAAKQNRMARKKVVDGGGRVG